MSYRGNTETKIKRCWKQYCRRYHVQ